MISQGRRRVASSRSMLDSLDHAIILVRDLDAACGTYAALLGRRPSWRGEHPTLGTANVLYRLDNTYLELLSPQPEGSLAEGLRARLEGNSILVDRAWIEDMGDGVGRVFPAHLARASWSERGEADGDGDRHGAHGAAPLEPAEWEPLVDAVTKVLEVRPDA